MKYFSISELTHSDTAVSLGMDNTPTKEQAENLERLVRHVLDPIRQQWGRPLKVTSGFRSPAINFEVGGVEDSYHMDGCAADITAGSTPANSELMSLIRTMHLMGILRLTECYADMQRRYIHIAYDVNHIDPYPFI